MSHHGPLHCAIFVFALVGCPAPSRDPSIEAIEPAAVSSLAPTPARVRGINFLNAARVDLNVNGPATIVARWTTVVGGATIDTSWIDHSTLDVVVPAGLARGEHDVTIISPEGHVATLPRGLVVTDEPIGLHVAVEDAPGGLGRPVSATLEAGQAVQVFAVVRDPQGAFVTDLEVVWELVGAIGELSPGPSTSTTFSARRVGIGRIRALRSATGLVAESGELVVTAGPPVAIAIVDPNGNPIGDRDDLTTDPDGALEARAVGIDSNANVVEDRAVTWSLAGVSATLPATSAMTIVVDFSTTGVGVLTASDSLLGQDATGMLQVAPGRVAAMTVVPATLALGADDAAVPFTAVGIDADGNPTSNLGIVSWEIASGPITAIDPVTGLFDPTRAGIGTTRATSSHGPSTESGSIVVSAGRATALTVTPDNLSIDADNAPIAFIANAFDADGNPTADIGSLVWSISSGPISAIDPTTGELDPIGAGAGTVRAQSSLGPVDDASITITAGRAASLEIQPDTLAATADEAPVSFSVAARDADGNAAVDVGLLSWSIASGSITAIDPSTGVFDPRTAGIGTIGVTSSLGIGDTSGDIIIQPGVAVSLATVPDTLAVSADTAPIAFSATGVDADGNPTGDLGVLTWSIASGPISELDSNGILTPVAAGTGTIRVTSANGPTADTGAITIVPGRAATLQLLPATLTVDADTPPVPFTVAALDGDGNTTNDVGTIAWSIASGPITVIDANSGVFDPVVAGSGTIRATSSYGPSVTSGPVTVNSGALATLTVAPDTASVRIGGAPQQFTATGRDADGNSTGTGALTWSIASGPIGSIDAATGVLTPTSSGTGSVRATSSSGRSDDSGAVSVSAGIVIVSIDVPSEVVRGQRGARVEIVVQNTEPTSVPLTAGFLTFTRSGADVATDYVVQPEFRNPDAVPANSTIALAFDVDISGAPAFGSVDVTAHVQGFVAGSGAQSDTRTAAWTVLDVDPPLAIITFPGAARICAGGAVGFDASASTGNAPLSFLWDLPGGAPSTSTASAPSGIVFGSPGTFPYAVTITDTLGRQNTAFGSSPVYVGTVEADAYATGAIGFDKPDAGQLENMLNLPNTNFIDCGGGLELKQCSGSSIANGPNKYVTVWVDRGVIPLAMDSRPSIPGIQIALSATGLIKSVDLDNAAIRREGPAVAYAEFRRESDGVVTASGWVSFTMTNDTQPPAVAESIPAASCGASVCRGKGDPVLFRFTEPIQPASLSTVIVETGPAGSTCADTTAFADISAGSTITYDDLSATARVVPQALAASSYKVRIRLGPGVRDQSSNANALVAASLCINIGPTAPPATPTLPSNVSAAPDRFSPDFDATQDTVVIQASVDAATTSVRVTISHGPGAVISLVRGVTGPGVASVTWDGRDLSGRVVPDGHYLYSITASNRVGVESPVVEGVLTVDSAVSLIGVPARL